MQELGLRYFLLEKDQQRIDDILTRYKIIASTETINLVDYRDHFKIQKIYAIVAFIIIITILFISSI